MTDSIFDGAVKTIVDSYAAALAKVDELTASGGESNTANADLAFKVVDLTKRVDTLTADNTDLTATNASLDAGNKTLQANCAALTADKTALQANCAALTADKSSLQKKLDDALAQVATGSTNKLDIGWRSDPAQYSTVQAFLGDPQVARVYEQGLPTSFADKGYPASSRLIVSYKSDNGNLEKYLRSIPASRNVELCWQHESELDGKFAKGSDYVAGFTAQRNAARAVRPDIPFVHIAATYAYVSGKNGYDGSYIPEADRYYCDSYMRGNEVTPFEKSERSQRYVQLLKDRGKNFHGVCEYGRGNNNSTDPVTDTAKRVMCIWMDAQYFRKIGATTLIAWMGTDWGFSDPDSIASWNAQRR